MQNEETTPNKKLSVFRSSSTSLLPDFIANGMQENPNDLINQEDQLNDDFEYSKYIIPPGQSYLSDDDSRVPISKAKDQIMNLMKLSNDEYIAQVENMKRSEKSLESINNTIKEMEPVKFNIIHHPIYYEIAMNNYTIEYCNEEIERIRLNIDSYGILYNEIVKILGPEAFDPHPQSDSNNSSATQSSNSILLNDNSQHRSSIDDTAPKARYKRFGNSILLRRRTTAAKRTSLTLDSSPIVQTEEQQSKPQQQEQQQQDQKPQQKQDQQPQQQQKTKQTKQQKTPNQESHKKERPTQQLQKKQKAQKRTQTPPQQKMKNSEPILPQTIQKQISKENLVNISGFISDCLKIRNNPHNFIQRRSLLHRLYLPFPIERPIEIIDPNKPNEFVDDKNTDRPPNGELITYGQNLNTEGKNPLFKRLNEEARNAFIIDPNVDKVGYLINPKSKSGRIIQRFILKSNEMQYEDVDVIADALYDLTSEYLTKDEIIGILFDLLWTANPSKYPIVPRVNTFWVPYIMDLIPAAIDPPYLSEKWKRMTFNDLSNTKDWPLREAVDSLFDLYLHSNPFEIGRCFSKTINLVAKAVQDMVEEEGGKREDVEIDFDQLFNLLIVCIFASGLPTITKPLSYASFFDQYAYDNSEIHFAMTHMEGLSAHLPKMNFMELREKSNRLKEQYQKEDEENNKKE